ncbi:MAG: dihydrodipicolinate synthase family protein, partial [Oscillospiraceae bacterium]|nr:dihydrodipicolinate synthase family protein [Candidatus Equicaccousia limihippi]
YTHIATHVDAPIILYNVPSRTGLNIEPQTYKELSKIDNIVATKEASGNLEALRQTMELCGDALTVYSGNDDQMFEITQMGGKGVISVFSNILPTAAHDIIIKAIEGDLAGAKELSDYYMPLMKGLFTDVNPVPCKEAMNMLKMPAGVTRLPLVPMLEGKREELKKILQSYNLI